MAKSPTNRRGFRTAGAAVLGGLLVLAPGGATTAAPPVWELKLERSDVRIAGSVHYLRSQDYPLPDLVERAYQDADRLVVEYDSNAQGQPVDPMVLTRRVPRAGRLQPPGELRRTLSTAEFNALRGLAEDHGYDVERLDDLKPWFAGMYVLDRALGDAGFESRLGLDNYLLAAARDDGKPVIGLESAEEQRRLFSGVPLADQVDFLIESLRDAPRMGEAMARLVERWRRGDLAALERSLLMNLKRRPDEYRRFSVERNRRWLDRILDLPDDGTDYLVVVGVVHLLGEDSLVSLLRERGYPVRRLEALESDDCAAPGSGCGR